MDKALGGEFFPVQGVLRGELLRPILCHSLSHSLASKLDA